MRQQPSCRQHDSRNLHDVSRLIRLTINQTVDIDQPGWDQIDDIPPHEEKEQEAVSYTHLTLPTIVRV